MKRAHKRNHLIIWAVLAPVLALILWLALSLRPAEPVNDELPQALATEAQLSVLLFKRGNS